jgi:hypothetical protein
MPAHTSSTPTFPIPASERVHSTTTASTPATVPTPVTTASTPTTTYVPAGATPLPGTKSTGVGTTATPSTSTLLGHVVHKRSQHSSTLSTGAIAVAVVAAVLVLACIGWALARRRAFEPHWLLSLRHSMAEAGYRASATWAEFTDWVRLGH